MDLWPGVSIGVAIAEQGGAASGGTYSDCSEDILELIYESDQTGVVDVNSVRGLLAFRILFRGAAGKGTHAVGLVAMAGEWMQG